LRDTIKVSVARSSASVYSTSVYGGVQNFGGRVGRNHATLIKRASVSQYMTRAAQTNKERVAREVEGVLDWLAEELEK
jgi:phage gpG-like protein